MMESGKNNFEQGGDTPLFVPRFADDPEGLLPAEITVPNEVDLPAAAQGAQEGVSSPSNPDLEKQRYDRAASTVYRHKETLWGGVRFTGPDMARLGDGYAKYALAELAELQKTAAFEGESGPSEAERTVLAVADDGIDYLGALANVEPRTADSPVRMFDRWEDYEEAYRVAYSGVEVSGESAGTYTPRTGMLWLRRAADNHPLTKAMNTIGLTHERIHQRASRLIIPRIDAVTTAPDGGTHYTVTPKHRSTIRFIDDAAPDAAILEEAVTDMGANRIWRRVDGTTFFGYGGPDILLGGVIQETADKLGIPEQQVEFALYRCMLGDDNEGPAMIREALGPERANFFFNFPTLEDRSAAEAADHLGLTDAAAYIRHLSDLALKGRPSKPGEVEAFEWQPRVDSHG